MKYDYQIPMFEIDQKIAEYKSSLTLGTYLPGDLDPSKYLENELKEFISPVNTIKELSNSKKLSVKTVAEAITKEPLIVEVVRLILALPSKIEFRDGRRFPNPRGLSSENSLEIAEIINEMGFWNLVSKTNRDIVDLVRIALIHATSTKRKFRANKSIEVEIEHLIFDTLVLIKKQVGLVLEIDSNSSFDFKTRRSVDYVIKFEGRPIAAIDVLFTTNPGGSQAFDLSRNYPELQNELSMVPMKLIVIADGPGMSRISERALVDMFSSVQTVISIQQAKEGMLTKALIGAATEKQFRTEPVDRIIESILFSGDSVTTNQLPKTSYDLRLALAQYVTENPHLDLTLSPGGKSLKWNKAKLIKSGLELADNYKPNKTLELFGKLLDGNLSETKLSKLGLSLLLDLRVHPIVPSNTLVISLQENIENINYHDLAREALQTTTSKLMFLIVRNKANLSLLLDKGLQSTLPINIIALDISDLIKMAQSKKDPRDLLTSIVLEQSDLTKISPFVINSTTPRAMYYGRQKEEATLINTLTSHSIALLGSRKIGKTSLLRNAKDSLSNAGFNTFFLDCQTVNSWESFGEMAQRYWEISLPNSFEPMHLFDMVKTFRQKSKKNIVFLLDEIDQLLKWDSSHEKDQVPEAFFKACRTISQNGEAQFVFSGERTISEKLWDSHSPHWNFCKPLQLRQLDKNSTRELIVQPLRSLQIQILNTEKFVDKAWRVTSGHPQIVQLLGDKLVNILNLRPANDRAFLSFEDIDQVSETLDFQEHYLSTYWGQATDREKLISLLLVNGVNQPATIIEEFKKNNLDANETEIIVALRILELYGIADVDGDKYKLRAIWFENALNGYGDIESTIERYWKKIK